MIFTGGQADLDTQGAVVHPDDLETQTHSVLLHVESILNDLESSLVDLVKLIIYFTGDASDEAQILNIIASRLSVETRPVVSTICLQALCYPGMRIELEAVAIDPILRTEANPQYMRSSALYPLPDQYSHVVRCNDLIFTGDVSAIEPDGTLPASGDVVEQTRLMVANLELTLSLAESSADKVLKLNVFYLGDGTAESWTEPAAIRAAFFPDPGPAATGIAVTGFARAGLMTKIAVTAAVTDVLNVIPDEATEVMHSAEMPSSGPSIRYSWPKGHWNWTSALPYKHGNRFCHIIHLGGQVALDVNAEVLHPDDIVEQTKIALINIKLILVDLGASMDDVVKVTSFYQGNASADGLHKNLTIRSDAFSSPGPATSGIPVPHLVYEKMLIEIEVIAVVG